MVLRRYVTYVGGLCSPPTYDLTTLIPGFSLVGSRMGVPTTDTEARFHSLLCHKLTPTSYSEVDQNRKESTELETRTSLKDIEQTT